MAEPITFFDRPSVAFQNLLEGEVGAAGTALLSPDKLSPSQRQKFLESEGFLGELVSVVTNPLVLLGLAASVRFPIAPAHKQFQFKKNFLDWTQGMGIIGKQTSSTRASLMGTQLTDEDKIRFGFVDDKGQPYESTTLVDLFDNVFMSLKGQSERGNIQVGQAYQRFLDAKGIKEISPQDQATLAAYLDGLWRQGRGTNAAWGPAKPHLDAMPGLTKENFSIIRPDLEEVLERTDPDLLQLGRDLHQWTRGWHEEIFGLGNRQAIAKAIARRSKKEMGVRYSAGMTDDQVDRMFRDLNIEPTLQGYKKALSEAGLPSDGDTLDELAKNLQKQFPGSFTLYDSQKAQRIGQVLAEKGIIGGAEELEWYFPHIMPRSQGGWEDFAQQLMEAADWQTAVKANMDTAAVTEKLSAHARRRRYQMAPSNQDLKLIEHLMTPEGKAVLWGTTDNKIRRELSAKYGRDVGAIYGRNFYEYDLELNILSDLAQERPEQFMRQGRDSGNALLQALGYRKAEDREAILRTIFDEDNPTASRAMERLNTFVRDKAPNSPKNQYSMMTFPALSRYIHNTSVQKAWLTDGYQGISNGEMIQQLTKQAGGPIQNMVKETMIPLAQGRLTGPEAIQSLEWVEARNRMISRLDRTDHWSHRLGINKWLKDRLVNYAGPMTWGQFGGHLAGLFYNSTLGLNPASALKNTLQTVVTTGPLIGFRHLAAGQKETAQRISEYMRMRKQHGHEIAFESAFGDFIQAGLDPHPAAENMLSGFVDEAYRSSGADNIALAGHRAQRAWRTAQDKMMSLFQKSEQFNRMSTFYAGIHRWNVDMRKHGLDHKVMVKLPRPMEGTDVYADLYAIRPGGSSQPVEGAMYARNLVNMTQFPAGPGQTPHMLRNLPAPLRQFTHFPLRFLEFLNLSTMQPWGSGPYAAKAGGLGGLVGIPLGSDRNLGTLGRVLAGSTLAAGAGAALLNTDLSSGLLTGALPLPHYEGAPFYPMPIVPPLVGMAGAVGMDLMSGEFDQTKRALPLLVPGGVAFSRAARYLPRDYGGRADYEHRTPDGRVPMYTENGSLKGYMTPMQLFGAAIGLKPMDMEKEQALMGYLIKQRDEIRTYRREYLEAISRNDFQAAETVKSEFRQAFPELGELKIRPQDLRAVKTRHQVTRLERLLDTMPRQYRNEYGQMVSMALGQEAAGLLGVDPSLLGAPETTVGSRPRLHPSLFRDLRTQPPHVGAEGRENAQQTTNVGGSFSSFTGF